MSDGPSAHGALTLSRALSHSALNDAWRHTVRAGLRKQDLTDLHDHLDTHWRLPQLVSRLHAEAVTFRYRPKEPEIARVEKSKGIARRTVVPAAIDSIIIQALTDSIAPAVLKAQPTKTAFFSRSRRQPQTMANLDDSFPSDWLSLWKEGQRRIMRFTQAYKYVVVTDVANYFDAIPLNQLRNRIASLGHFAEVVLDLLFDTLEALTWRPEYLPRSGTGLPQIQFEAPRLLAHAYLYEADRFLRHACRNDVVRWMDDICFGAPDVETAKRVLRDLDELLASLGIRLNTGKTQILSASDGERYFRMRENRYLTTVENSLGLRPSNPSTILRSRMYLRALFVRFNTGDRSGYWDKIVKRFITIFGKLSDAYLQRWVPEFLESVPTLRYPVFRYYEQLGYSRSRFRQIQTFLLGPHCVDDSGVFAAADLLVKWSIPTRSPSAAECVRIAHVLPTLGSNRTVRVCAALALTAKYGAPNDIERVVSGNEREWRTSEWAARQVAAVTPRMLSKLANAVSQTIAGFGLSEGAAVLTHLEEIRTKPSLTKAEWKYVVHPSDPYPLSKVLVCITLLSGSLGSAEKLRLRADLGQIVSDGKYRKLLGL